MSSRAAVRAPVSLRVFLCLLATLSFAPALRLHAQETIPAPRTEFVRGRDLYKRGDIKGAVKALRSAVKQDKTDAEAWYFLSLALNSDKDVEGSRKAVQKSLELRPDFAPARAGLAYLHLLSGKVDDAMREAERALSLDPPNPEASYVIGAGLLRKGKPAAALEAVDAALINKPDFAAAFFLKSQALVELYVLKVSYVKDEPTEDYKQRRKANTYLLVQAAESLDRYFLLNPSAPNADVWREQLESLRFFMRNESRDASDPVAFAPSSVTTRARILSRPEPGITEASRKVGVQGTVVLRAIFAEDGTVKRILVVHPLPYGLTEEAVRAARKIKFAPAIKDGQPVPQLIQIEYNFYID